MIERAFISISLLIMSKVSLSCAFGPRTSPDYDSLINVSGKDSEGLYTITVPNNLTSYPPILMLQYTKTNKKHKNIISSLELPFKVKHKTVVAHVPIKKRGRTKAFIYVIWPAKGGMCSIYGKSGYIRF